MKQETLWDNTYSIKMAIPAGIYLFKDNVENDRTIYETCSKLAMTSFWYLLLTLKPNGY